MHFSLITCARKRLMTAVILALSHLLFNDAGAQDTSTAGTIRISTANTSLSQTPRDVSMIMAGDSKSFAPNKKRVKLAAISSVAIYGGALLALNQAWYSGYPRSSFHTFNDNAEWLQTDKVGHAWSAYQLARLSYGAWKWTGLQEKKAVLLGGLSGPGFLTVIEILDGFSSEWGWSWGDMSANVFGGGLFVGQQLGWHDQRIDYKFSVHRIDYGNDALVTRADKLFGASLPERFLKDYNAQTYWLSANLKSFFKQSHIPSWLNIAVGYGANGMFGAFGNLGKDDNGVVNFDRRDIRRYRQWYVAPDIRWRNIKTRSKVLKTFFVIMDGIKFPLPGLQLSEGKLQLKGLLF